MRLPTISLDFWQLVSGEERQQAGPSTFEIPTLTERSNLTSGQAAKLIFEIEAEEEDGTVSTSTERMWVIVSRNAGNYYFGILDSEPVTVPDDGQFYLLRGAASSPDKAQPHPGNKRIPKVDRMLSDDQVTVPRQSTLDAPLAYPGYGLIRSTSEVQEASSTDTWFQQLLNRVDDNISSMAELEFLDEEYIQTLKSYMQVRAFCNAYRLDWLVIGKGV